jgi:TolB-like protein
VPVAVLPFTTASGDKADQYFADALTQLIHNKALRISPQASAFRKLLRDIREVGRKLKVSHLLEAVVEALRVLHPLEQNYQSGKFSMCR